MNIHIKDKELFNNLNKATLVRIEVGSTMYGTNDTYSDRDYLSIYATSIPELHSFLNSHHQLQYKDCNIDYNFTSIHTFIRNLINGDSTINFEVVNSNKLIGTPLEFLYNMRHDFNNYSIIRGYLGIARHDFKYYGKQKEHRDQIKKIMHIWRGYYFAKSILESNFRNYNSELLLKVHELRELKEDDFVDKKNSLREAVSKISELREVLNEKFNNNTLGLAKYMCVSAQAKLDFELLNLIRSTIFTEYQKSINNIDLSYFYNSFENWVEYE